MTDGRPIEMDADPGRKRQRTTTVSSCESRPGTSVFVESGNIDAWIASDTTVDVNP